MPSSKNHHALASAPPQSTKLHSPTESAQLKWIRSKLSSRWFWCGSGRVGADGSLLQRWNHQLLPCGGPASRSAKGKCSTNCWIKNFDYHSLPHYRVPQIVMTFTTDLVRINRLLLMGSALSYNGNLEDHSITRSVCSGPGRAINHAISKSLAINSQQEVKLVFTKGQVWWNQFEDFRKLNITHSRSLTIVEHWSMFNEQEKN